MLLSSNIYLKMEEQENFDTSWIEQQERYQNIEGSNRGREQCNFINIHYIYVNKENNVEKINHEKYPLDHSQSSHLSSNKCSLISKENVLRIIQSRKIFTPTSKYKFEDIILYNVDIEPENIQSYENIEPNMENSREYFKVLPFINDITIPDSVFIFHQINCLFFIFKEYCFQESKKPPLKSILKSSSIDGEQLPRKHTKKVRIQTSFENTTNLKNKHRKTRKIRMIMKHYPVLENTAI